MREDFLEALDKMFPDGYAIAYSCPDGQMRFAHYDPNKAYQIARFHELAVELGETEGKA